MISVTAIHILVLFLLSPAHVYAVEKSLNISDQTKAISTPLGEAYPGGRNSDSNETLNTISFDTSATATSADSVFIFVDRMPEPIGGHQAIYAQMTYPDSARLAGIEGRVVVEFVVNKLGEVINPMIILSPGGGLDEVVLEGIIKVPFEPGITRGEAVNVRMQYPVLFRLEPSQEALAQQNTQLQEQVIYEISDDSLDTFPEPIGGMQAIYQNVRYPQSARLGGYEGQVVVRFIIDKEGNVVNPEVIKSVGGGLDESAIYALTQTKFTPALRNGVPVDVSITMPIVFRLTSPQNTRSRRNSRN